MIPMWFRLLDRFPASRSIAELTPGEAIAFQNVLNGA